MRKKNLIIIVMCVAICIMAVGYAAFNTTLTITGTSNITSEWNVVFTSITQVSKTSGVTIVSNPVVNGTSATFDVGLALPGDKIVYEITIENKGTINAIIENIVASASDSPAIIFSMEGVNIGDKIPNKTSKTLTVTIEYDKNVTSQPEKTNKVLTVDMTVVQDAGQSITPVTPEINQPIYLSGAILKDNVAQSDANIDFSQISSDTNGKGLYYTSTNTEGNKTTYYFRGAVDNNYVKMGKRAGCGYNGQAVWSVTDLANMQVTDTPTEEQCLSTNVCDMGTLIKEAYGLDVRYVTGLDDATCAYAGGTPTGKRATYGNNAIDIMWRIVRINEDGSIRLITQDCEGDSAFNENIDDNAYVGYMYGTPGSDTYEETHANEHDSTIKQYLDDWYEANLSSYAGYLADAGFCNDRSVAPSAKLWDSNDTALGYGTNRTYYGAENRLAKNKTPQFKCPNEERDLFTTSVSTKGNKALTYPIGLITADEVAYAGGVYRVDNPNMYLSGSGTWTMSPPGFVGLTARAWYLNSGGDPYNGYTAYNEYGGRPVVNLRSGVEIISGDGTIGNPYIIK